MGSLVFRIAGSGGGGGTCADGSWVTGKVGSYALEFGGTNEYVSLANPAGLELSEGTIAGWLKRGELDGRTTLISLGQAGSAANVNANWMLEIDANGTDDKLYMTVGNGTYYAYCKTDATIADTDWHHIAGSFTNNARDFVLYIDGVSQSLNPDVTTNAGAGGFTPGIAGTQEANLGVSVRTTAYKRFLTGKMDEVSIWSGCLSQANITSLAAGAKANAITASANIENNLLYYYKFDGNSNDTEGAANLTEVGGISYQTGLFADCVALDGSSDYLTDASTISAATKNDRSISLWFQYGGAQGYVCRLGYRGTIIIWVSSAGQIEAAYYDSSETSINPGYLYAGMSVGNWYHIVFTIDESDASTGAKLYVNGAQAGSSFGGATGFNNTSGNALSAIGAGVTWGGGTNVPVSGSIDDLAIWDRVLTSTEVLDIYTRGNSNNECLLSGSLTRPSLAAYYSFEEGAGNGTLTDRTGNGHTGTLTNMNTGSC